MHTVHKGNAPSTVRQSRGRVVGKNLRRTLFS